MDYLQQDAAKAGSRFFLQYGGGVPTSAALATLASTISSAWGAQLAAGCAPQFSLVEVDVLDIASYAGASGSWTGSIPGTATGAFIPGQVACNVEFDIARRYRGGKPRMFLPPSTEGNTLDAAHWSSAFVTSQNAAVAAFFGAIVTGAPSSMAPVSHVNLSYYSGFTNVPNSSGRVRAVPTYRKVALIDPIEGYATKQEFGSQRRRRIATTY